MSPENPAAGQKLLWAGYIVSGLVAALLLFSAVMKLLKPPELVEEFTRFGYDTRVILWIGLVELACTILYAAPRTATLGAILLTGYFGGAVATHVRIGEGFAAPVVIGVVAWLGLYLRDARLRGIAPWRS